MRGLRIVLGLVGVFALATTAAADQSMYFGGGLGLYDLKIDGGSSYSPPTAGVEQFSLGSGESFEDSSATYHVFAGYQLNKYIGLQADYVWYGTAEDLTAAPVPLPPPFTGARKRKIEVSGDAWEVSVRPSFPIGEHFELFGRVGWNWYNVDAKIQYVNGQSDGNDALLYAGGVGFKFTPAFSMTAEYEVVDIDGGDLSSATINFVYTIPR